MDLTKLSNEDLLALKGGDLSRVSNEGLMSLRGASPPSVAGGASLDTTGMARSMGEFASSRDPGIDYATGVRNAAFRAGFSRMSGEQEKAAYLDRFAGQGNWTKDSFGAYVLKPEGVAKLGQVTEMPVAMDEQTTSRFDLADVVGDLPALLGGVGMGMAATGMGALPGVGLSALGAAGGKALDEVIKNLQGHRRQSAGEIAGDIATEGALAAGGEGLVRAARPVGRFLMGPGSSRMTPEKKELMDTAIEQGFKPRPGQVTDAPILARWEGMVKKIFGDLNKEQNDAATETALQKLRPDAKVSMNEAGEAVRSALISGRRSLSQKAGEMYADIDSAGQIIPAQRLKTTAQEILDSLPKTEEGKPVFASPETVGLLNDIMAMPEKLTASQMQQVRTTLREASTLKNLTPDLSKHHARLLRQAADGTFDDAAGSNELAANIVAKLRHADSFYKTEIAKFDNKLVTAITRDPGKIGSLEPELVVDAIIKPGQGQKIARIKNAVSPEAWGKVQAAHAEEILSSVIKNTDDPLAKVFDGKALRDALNKYGDDTLTAVHGSEWAANAKRLAQSLMLTQKGMNVSGAIVAANIALHPLANLGKLVFLRGMAKLIQQPGTLHYLTEGIRAPNTRNGIEALTRVATQAALIADDETGSASFTLTNPKAPQP